MADTGSTLNPNKVSKTLGAKHQYLVGPVSKDGQAAAERANGGTVDINGEIDIAGIIDEELNVIPFEDMDVTMPIASMRQTRGSRQRPANHQGSWHHLQSKQKVR